MFSVRIGRELRTQIRRYAVDSEKSMQTITEAALLAYLNDHAGDNSKR